MRRIGARRRRLAGGLCAGVVVLVAIAGGWGCGNAADGSGPTTGASEPGLSMPPGRLAGARIVIGLAGPGIPSQARAAIRHGDASGVVLYAENFPSRAYGRRLIADLQAIPRPVGMRDPLLILVDQEGGLVKRVSGAPFGSALEIGRRGPAFARREGRRTGRNLRRLGVNVDLAPVLDVPRPGSPIEETGRGYGGTAAQVSAAGVSFAEGLQEAGVAATAKHFPGLGAAVEDTDVEVSRIGLSRARLRTVDEAPYRHYAAAGGDMVMVSAATYPAFSPQPATFSRELVTGELRGRLGYRGVVMTDALNTVSVAAFGDPAKSGLAAARAGCDLLLFTDVDQAQEARRALAARLRSGSLDPEQFERAAQRVLDLRAGLRR